MKTGRLKTRERKTQDWKTRDENRRAGKRTTIVYGALNVHCVPKKHPQHFRL